MQGGRYVRTTARALPGAHLIADCVVCAMVRVRAAVNYVGRLWPSKELFDQAHATKPLVIELGQGLAGLSLPVLAARDD